MAKVLEFKSKEQSAYETFCEVSKKTEFLAANGKLDAQAVCALLEAGGACIHEILKSIPQEEWDRMEEHDRKVYETIMERYKDMLPMKNSTPAVKSEALAAILLKILRKMKCCSPEESEKIFLEDFSEIYNWYDAATSEYMKAYPDCKDTYQFQDYPFDIDVIYPVLEDTLEKFLTLFPDDTTEKRENIVNESVRIFELYRAMLYVFCDPASIEQ